MLVVMPGCMIIVIMCCFLHDFIQIFDEKQAVNMIMKSSLFYYFIPYTIPIFYIYNFMC